MSVAEDPAWPKKKSSGKPRLKAKTAYKLGLTTRFLSGDDSAFPAWQAHLRRRKSPRPITKVLKCKNSPLTWGLESIGVLPETVELLESLWKLSGSAPASPNGSTFGIASAASDWLAVDMKDVDHALRCVGWASALPGLVTVLDAAFWRALLARLTSVAEEATATRTQPEGLASQLFAVELPITLAYQFPESEAAKRLETPGSMGLCESLVERLDGAGLPAAADLIDFRAWIATWTRSLQLAESAGLKVTRKAHEQFDWMVRQALRLVRADGSQVFWPPGLMAANTTSAMFESALKITADADDKALAKMIFDKAEVRDSRLPEEPGYESEWSGFAVLQPEWSPHEPRLAVDFSQPQMRCEFSVGGNLISQGAWQTRVLINNRHLQPKSTWESICWQADEDVDYLEVECELTEGWRLQRQFVFARQDYFLFIADALLGSQPSAIEIQQCIPLADGVSCSNATETVERYLSQRRKRALVIPPALSEWRCDRRLGEMEFAEGELRQTITQRGRAAYLPLFLDLHPRRMRKQRTWRRLTVAEDLKTVNKDVAVAYRVHVGPEQWLIYRSLQPGLRSALGQNMISDFLCARFLDDGDVDPIIEIEDD